ncbi:hypothetical protein AACH06_04675 [Ideonella sp. DXS29W]|uniref:Uncharacterized protein n=1 Tax=Ideonella lacteola TaxID=2984193 RepID=A0ABU9BK27_9BURK
MPALHAKAPPLVVANARHGPGYGGHWRFDKRRRGLPFGQVRKTLSL